MCGRKAPSTPWSQRARQAHSTSNLAAKCICHTANTSSQRTSASCDKTCVPRATTARPRHLSNRTCGTCMTRTPPNIRRRLTGGARKPKGGDLKARPNSEQDAPIQCNLRVCLARHAHGKFALAVHRYALHRRPHQIAKAGGNSNPRSHHATPTVN